jgi:hypothetical protein
MMLTYSSLVILVYILEMSNEARFRLGLKVMSDRSFIS